MNSDEHDDLWRLLGKARSTRVSPFFSRNVLRAIREEQPEHAVRWVAWLRARWAYVWATAALAAIVITVLPATSFRSLRERGLDPIDQAAIEVASSPDFNVIANLDDLLASQDNDVWLASFEE